MAADALIVKVREGGRVVNVHALAATGVNADGHREIRGRQVTPAEDGAGWLAFFRDLTARGLVGVVLAEQHDEWAEGRRYLGVDILADPALPAATRPRKCATNSGIPALSD